MYFFIQLIREDTWEIAISYKPLKSGTFLFTWYCWTDDQRKLIIDIWKNILKSLKNFFYSTLKISLNKNSISIMVFVTYIHHFISRNINLLSIHFSALSNGEISETNQKYPVIWPRKQFYRGLFTSSFFQQWVNLISLSKSQLFGLLKGFNTCLICAGGPKGDLYTTALLSSANRDFLYLESGSISDPCINLA